MPRTLSVSRVRVRAGREAEYLAAVRALACVARGGERHLWIFRSVDQPGLYLECSESRSREAHRAVAEPSEDERRLEARLRAVAEYEPGAWELWEEVGD